MSWKNKYPAKIDLPVLLIFFTRPDTFKEVFAAVKEARPSKLFLACDGPRDGRADDVERIAACKKIAEDIDWECEVHTNYAEENMGCGMRPQTAISWVFEHEECAVILEDDCVPHASFFPYMTEMLERYKNDTRISSVSAFNHFINWDCDKYSYFFAKVGPLAGAWGSWRRVWQYYDYHLNGAESKYLQRLMYDNITCKRAKKRKLEIFSNTHKRLSQGENLSYWDFQFSFIQYSQSCFSIVPCFSLASNIGLGEGATHGNRERTHNPMPSIFFASERPLAFPLVHPEFVICDCRYDNQVDATWAYPHLLVHSFKRGVRLLRRILKI